MYFHGGLLFFTDSSTNTVIFDFAEEITFCIIFRISAALWDTLVVGSSGTTVIHFT